MRFQAKPTLGRLVVEVLPEEERTKTGLYIVTSRESNNHAGRVTAVCELYQSAEDDLDPSPSGPNFKVGQLVLFGKWSGIETTIGRGSDAEKIIILNESDILATLEEVEDGGSAT